MALQNEIPSLDEVIVEFGRAKEAAVPVGQPLNILVWNIFKAKRQGLLADLQQFAKNAQFAILQETVVNRQVAQEMVKLNDFGWQNALSFYQRNGDGTGVVTGAVYQAAGVNFSRSRSREPITNTPKMAVITEYPVQGRDEKLLIANIHALNFVPNTKFKQQLDELGDLLSRHQGPMILAGDFNTHHNDRILILAKMAERLGLHMQPLRNDRRLLRLDHVLVRGVEVHDAEVVLNIHTSDHFPVRVTFSL